jgi:hypothetical protein
MPIETAPGTGVLQFASNPSNAIIIIDDQEYTVRTPSAIKNIPPGSHVYTIRTDGYQDVTEVADVKEGILCCINANLVSTTAQEVCNPTIIPETGVPTPTPPSGFGGWGLVFGFVLGIVAISILKEK